MKAACLLMLALNIAALGAAYIPNQTWSYKLCRSAFGMCDYPLVLALGVAAWVAMFIMLKEIN